MNDDLTAKMAGQAALFSIELAKSFKEQALVIKGYNRGFTDATEQGQLLMAKFISALDQYEKARETYGRSLPAAVKMKEAVLEKVADEIEKYLTT